MRLQNYSEVPGAAADSNISDSCYEDDTSIAKTFYVIYWISSNKEMSNGIWKPKWPFS
jgi:hypothetical protein